MHSFSKTLWLFTQGTTWDFKQMLSHLKALIQSKLKSGMREGVASSGKMSILFFASLNKAYFSFISSYVIHILGPSKNINNSFLQCTLVEEVILKSDIFCMIFQFYWLRPVIWSFWVPKNCILKDFNMF